MKARNIFSNTNEYAKFSHAQTQAPGTPKLSNLLSALLNMIGASNA